MCSFLSFLLPESASQSGSRRELDGASQVVGSGSDRTVLEH